ncbi:hypothetical protein FRC15_001170 [Serendipita sp. 397]|nr:hypothetical protein FRC15_001170 [Serendipita sp. 397]
MPHGSDPISETYKDNGGCEPGDLRITFVSMAFSLPTPSFALKRDESRWDGLPPLVKAETVFELVWAALSALLFLFIVFKLFKIRISSTPRGPYILLALVPFTSAISNARYFFRFRKQMELSDFAKFMTASNILGMFAQVFEPAVVLWLTQIRGQAFGSQQPGSSSPIVARTWKRVVDWVLAAVTFIYLVALECSTLSHSLKLFHNFESYQEYQEYQEYFKLLEKLQHLSTVLFLLLSINVVASLFTLWFSQRRARFTDSVVTRLLTTSTPFILPLVFIWLFFDIWRSETIEANRRANLAYVIIEGVCQVGIIASVISTMDLHADTDPSGSSSNLNQPSSPIYKEA